MADSKACYPDSKIRFLKCVIVVMDTFTLIVSKLMEKSPISAEVTHSSIYGDQHFKKKLTTTDHTTLQTLLTDGYSKLDLTLMFKIITYFKMFVSPPTRGWNSTPVLSETTIGDDTQRIRLKRNHFMHQVSTAVSEQEFEDFFSETTLICKRIDSYLKNTREDSFEQDVANIKVKPLVGSLDVQTKYDKERSIEEFFATKIGNAEFKVYKDKSIKDVLQTLRDQSEVQEQECITLTFPELSHSELHRIKSDLLDEINKKLVNIKVERIREGSLVIELLFPAGILLKDDLLQTSIKEVLDILCEVGVFELDVCVTVDVVISANEVYQFDDQDEFVENNDARFSKGSLQLDLRVNMDAVQSEEGLKEELDNLFGNLMSMSNGGGMFTIDEPVVSFVQPRLHDEAVKSCQLRSYLNPSKKNTPETSLIVAGFSGIKQSLPEELREHLDEIHGKVAKASGCLSDLDKNRKRWLVTGVVLNSVLTPTLRTYVTDSLEQIYQDLKVKSNIDTQLYPQQLPSFLTTFLNYEAINGNKTWGLRQQSQFNYKVKDAVDLSKLFLKTHMAHYNAFDDSCDAFALLEIIIGSCPAASQACAKKVKDEVRNPWPHCDFTAWNDNKYKTCIELIKDLIESLGLPEQREIIITLQKWVQNGEKFIDGTSPEFVVLGEIQTQVQAVLSCIERIASDTPDQIPKLKKELTVANQSLSELLKRVQDLEKAGEEMTASISRLEKRMEEQESSIPKHMNEKYQIHIDRWKKDEETFSVTRATESVAKFIETNNVVTVVGSSGSGKSSIIHHVALQLESVQKFELIPFVSSPADIIQYRDMKKNQLFVIDDLCGKNYIDETDLQAWKTHSDKIEKLFPVDPSSEQGKLKILVSCRLQISKNEQFKQLDLFSKKAVDLQSEKYCLLPVERSTMIGKYIKNKILENRWQDINDKLADCHFFPLLCKLARGKNIHQLQDLFSSPIHSIRKDIKDMILKNPMENCALVLCVLFPDGFHEDFIDPETRPQNVQQKITDIIKNLKEVTLDNEREIEKFRKTFERLDGTYVKKLGPMYTISHDKMYDMVAVEGSYQMTKLFLKYGTSTLIAQLYRLKSIYKVDDNDILIYLNENYQNLYFDRIVQDLKEAKSYQPFFHNQQLKEEKYRKKVMEYIEQNKKSCDELFRRLDREGMTEERKEGDFMRALLKRDTYTYRTTPVIEATKTGFYDLVQYFIQINCDCNKKDSEDHSPLYYSCENGFVNVTDLLMRQGVEYDDELVMACMNGEIDVVRVMFDYGVDLSVCGLFGETPLTAACCWGQSEVVKLLLDKGADPLQTDLRGDTALDAAREWEREKWGDDTIINLLKSHMKQ